jgi:hypothetical protein
MERAGAGRLAGIERELDHLYKSLLLKLAPEEADAADLRPEHLAPLLTELAREAGISPDALAPAVTALEGLVPHGADFVRCTKLRGRAMAEGALRLLHSLARVIGGIAHVPHGIACAAAAHTRHRDQRAGAAVRAGLPACR